MHRLGFTNLAALLLVLCLCLSACTSKQTGTENSDIILPVPESAPEKQFFGEGTGAAQIETVLHYASEGSLSLGTTTRRISLRSNENAVHAILNELTTSAALSDSVEAEIIDIESGSGTVTVNLSIEAGVNRTQQDYLLLCASIANTLLEMESVDAVNILTGSRSDPLCGLPLGVFTEKKDNIAAAYAQIQSESEGSNSIQRNALIYFPAEETDYLLPEVRQLEFTDGDYLSPILEALTAGPLVRTCCFTAVPSNMDLLAGNAEIETSSTGERIIHLRFDPALDSYLAFSGIEDGRLYASLVLSLCSFVPEIDGVSIRLGDDIVSSCMLGGERTHFSGGIMRRQDFAPLIGGSVDCFFTEDNETLVRREAALSQSDSASPLRILQCLLDCSVPEGLASVFPDGLSGEDILGVHLEEKEAIVNLSSAFYSRCQNLSAQQERLLIYAMVNALTQLDEIGAVSFRVEGRQVETLAQDIYLKTPLLPDHGLIAAG